MVDVEWSMLKRRIDLRESELGETNTIGRTPSALRPLQGVQKMGVYSESYLPLRNILVSKIT